MRRRRILVVAPSFPPRQGGLEQQTAATARILAEAGHDVRVAACWPPGAQAEGTLAVPSRFLLADSFPVPRGRRPFDALLARERPDLVVTNTRFFLPTFQAARAARRARIPHVHVEHGGGHLRARSWAVDAVAWAFDHTAGRSVVRSAAACVAVSDAAAGFLRHLGARRIVTIPNSIDFPPAPRPPRTGRAPEVLFVGRLVPNKGVLDLVRAFPRVLARVPDARLAFVGQGPAAPALQREAARLGVPCSLEGPLPAEQVPPRMEAAALVANPSYSEGFGRAVLEAGSRGVPVVASDLPAHRELLDGGRGGLLHPPGDVAALADALVQALADPAATAERARHAYVSMRARFSPEAARAAWERLLAEVP